MKTCSAFINISTKLFEQFKAVWRKCSMLQPSTLFKYMKNEIYYSFLYLNKLYRFQTLKNFCWSSPVFSFNFTLLIIVYKHHSNKSDWKRNDIVNTISLSHFISAYFSSTYLDCFHKRKSYLGLSMTDRKVKEQRKNINNIELSIWLIGTHNCTV